MHNELRAVALDDCRCSISAEDMRKIRSNLQYSTGIKPGSK